MKIEQITTPIFEEIWLPWSCADVKRVGAGERAAVNVPNDGQIVADTVHGSMPTYTRFNEERPHLFRETRGYFLSEFNNVNSGYAYSLEWEVPDPLSDRVGLVDNSLVEGYDLTPDPGNYRHLSYYGYGNNDIVIEKVGAGYLGTLGNKLEVTIEITGANSAKYSYNGGSTWEAGSITINPPLAGETVAGWGVNLSWLSHGVGDHAVGDRWTFTLGDRLLSSYSDWSVYGFSAWLGVMAKRTVPQSIEVPFLVQLVKQSRDTATGELTFLVQEEEVSYVPLHQSEDGASISQAFKVSNHHWACAPSIEDRYFFRVLLIGDPVLDRIERRVMGVGITYMGDETRKFYTDWTS